MYSSITASNSIAWILIASHSFSLLKIVVENLVCALAAMKVPHDAVSTLCYFADLYVYELVLLLSQSIFEFFYTVQIAFCERTQTKTKISSHTTDERDVAGK